MEANTNNERLAGWLVFAGMVALGFLASAGWHFLGIALNSVGLG